GVTEPDKASTVGFDALGFNFIQFAIRFKQFLIRHFRANRPSSSTRDARKISADLNFRITPARSAIARAINSVRRGAARLSTG
ncbi:MAG TPA: hypothetical protein VJ718_01860, partial [Candidatus Binataceae bacterium]|nr:hypothetical protein [Candidatus Binataceae bacterium]